MTPPTDRTGAAPAAGPDQPGEAVLSIVTPAFNEEENLGEMYRQVRESLAGEELAWEWIIVDDHSKDQTFARIQELAAGDPRVRGIRLAHNSGSHAAITCGLHHCLGACAVIMAADLQDPPSLLPTLLSEWRRGNQVVWAVREGRQGERKTRVLASRFYYLIMRHFVGLKNIPPTGADFLLMDRVVIDAFSRFGERNVSILVLIAWMGFRQTFVTYAKQPRLHGRSGWNFRKKLKLALDSITAFTHLPIRILSTAGLIIAFLGFLFALEVVRNWLSGQPLAGWSSIMCAVLIIGGIQILMLGILGEYTWRSLDESRRRPPYLVEEATGEIPSNGQAPGPE